MKTCICCQEVQSSPIESKSEYLCVCPKCEAWTQHNMGMIEEHRKQLLAMLGDNAKKSFNDLSMLEQGYILIRGMEKVAKVA